MAVLKTLNGGLQMPFDDVRGEYAPEQEKPSLLWTWFVLAVFACIMAAIDMRVVAVFLMGLVILTTYERRHQIFWSCASLWRRIAKDSIVKDF